jgi:Uma2 family endonuclease
MATRPNRLIGESRYAERMPAATLVSVEEYLQTSYDPDCEFVDGQVLERNMGEWDHAGLQAVLIEWFASRRKALGLVVIPELRVQISERRYRVPDVAVVKGKGHGRVLRRPPFLCIEILSPEDRASRVEEKIDDYLAFGVPHVWLIDPRKRVAWSYTADQKRESAVVLATNDPRLEIPLADLFSELDEAVDLSEE